MKKISQIANETSQSNDSIRYAIIKLGIIATNIKNVWWINKHQEELIHENLYHELSIDLERVQIAFKQEYLTLPSRMNRD